MPFVIFVSNTGSLVHTRSEKPCDGQGSCLQITSYGLGDLFIL